MKLLGCAVRGILTHLERMENNIAIGATITESISHLSCCKKICMKKWFKEEEFILLITLGNHGFRQRRWRHGVGSKNLASQIALVCRKQRMISTNAQLLSPSNLAQDQVLEMVPSAFRVGFSTSINLIKKIPQRYSQRLHS